MKHERKGDFFEYAPPRVLFGQSEEERKNYYKSQFDLLIKYWNRIPWRQWGVGSAKQLPDILREIGAGETVLKVVDGNLTRCIDIVAVFIFNKNGEWLVEKPQVMSDGRIRNRRFPYISEKLRLGEDPIDSAIRAVKEESEGNILPTKERLIVGDKITLDQNDPYNTGSSSYPGLFSLKTLFTFAVIIEDSEYKKKYTEVDVSGTVTEHVWKPFSENQWYTGRSIEKEMSKRLCYISS